MSNTKRTHRERTREREKEKWRMRQRKCHTLVFLFCIGINDDDGDAVVHKRSSELAEVNSLDTILNNNKKSAYETMLIIHEHAYHMQFFPVLYFYMNVPKIPLDLIGFFGIWMGRCHFNQMLWSKSGHILEPVVVTIKF